MAYQSFLLLEFEARGVRKVTTGIIGLWQPIAFIETLLSEPSMPARPMIVKHNSPTVCWIVQLPIGNVSWVRTIVRQVGFTLLMLGATTVFQHSTTGPLNHIIGHCASLKSQWHEATMCRIMTERL
jgi:hypothetical protein